MDLTSWRRAMKAAWRERYGGPEVVEVRDITKPRPFDDQLLVRARAASVNRADLHWLAPRPRFLRAFMGVRAPRQHRVGIDVAGEVEVVGPNTMRFKPGDRVFADLFSFGMGGFAEYVCASERAFLPIPVGLTFEEAATLPHSAVLAVQGLRLRNGRTVKRGDRVLVVHRVAPPTALHLGARFRRGQRRTSDARPTTGRAAGTAVGEGPGASEPEVTRRVETPACNQYRG